MCISPGNRNTPLTIAFTNHTGFSCTSHVDERSSAFFALGQSKASCKPTIIITTSGTAAANLYPAIIEANLSQIPLLVFTADRPPDIVGTGSNQTIRQQEMFGYQVRHFHDIGLPTENTNSLTSYLIQAYRISMGFDHFGLRVSPPGPVHLNIPFDEPLYLNEDLIIVVEKETDEKKVVINFQHSHNPLDEMTGKFSIMKNYSSPLIVCGRMELNQWKYKILELAENLGAPVFADPVSQLRYGYVHPHIFTTYDKFLQNNTLHPDIVIRFGSKPTSKKLTALLDEWREYTVLISPVGRFNDDCPNLISGDPESVINELIAWSTENKNEKSWFNQIKKLEDQSGKKNNDELNTTSFTGGIVAKCCMDSLSNEDVLFIGNSLPIRNLDGYTSNSDQKIKVFANRGASGIDGVVSTALGLSYSFHHSSPTANHLLLIGDLSFYHDMNGLLAAKRYDINLTIVVENNHGGGIFRKLSLNENNPKFIEFWETPTNLSIEKISKLYEGKYCKASNKSELIEYLDKTKGINGLKIIETIVSP